MLTHSLNFFVKTKRISEWHHFCKWKFLWSILQVAVYIGTMQLTFSIAIMQVLNSVAIMQVLSFYCNYVGGTFCFSYAGGSFCCNYARDCFCCSYTVIEVSAALMQIEVFAGNMRVTIFIEIVQVGVSVAIMQVLFSAVHHARDYFYYNYAVGCFCCSYVCDSFKWQLYIRFCNWHAFFIKLTRKHLKALYQVCISPFL